MKTNYILTFEKSVSLLSPQGRKEIIDGLAKPIKKLASAKSSKTKNTLSFLHYNPPQ